MTTIPSVNYGLSMPLLDTVQLTSGITAQQSHKAMSLGQGQLVFDPQVRVTAEQQSPTFGRFDGSKSLRTDAMTRNQLLEAARMWGSSTSLYNQFGSILSDVSGPTMASLSSSPSPGSGGNISKANQLQMHDPPPAHSSNTTRLLQRNPHSTDLIYGRSQESLIPSSLAPISLYSSNSLGKQSLANSQQQSLHRQTPVHIQQSYSSQSDIEDLSSNSQNQIYGSYANLSVSDSQDFSAQLSGDISYEAVSPAAPISENSQVNQEHTSFSMVQFPDLANLTSEHAHTLADKFQENDFRLKMDSSRVQQQHQDMLSSPHSGQRQDMGGTLKIPKDMSNLHLLSMQMNQRSNQYQPGLMMGQSMSISQNQGATMNINHPATLGQVSQHNSMTTSSMQQSPAPIPIQALADSTTKPKRSRNRKKKETNPPQAGSPVNDIIKKSSTQAPTQMSHHSSHILNMPPTSPHISTLSLGSHGNQGNQMQQQQIYRNSAGNQYTSRDAQRAQTPSMPQNYSLQDHQNHGYPPAPSPKMSVTPNQNLMRSQNEFVLPTRVVNDKSSSSSYKHQQQRKSLEASPKSNTCSSNQVYRSNIPENQQHMQSFGGHPGMMTGSGQQRGSPMQDSRSSLSRMQSFADQSPHQKLSSQMSPLGQPSPQGNDNGNYNNSKMGSSGHMMGSGMIGSQSISISHSPMDSRPVSVEPSGLSHGYDQGHPPGLIDTQDPSQFHLDFSGPPFLEQLVGSPTSMAVPSTSYGHSTGENGEVVFTTLVTPAESARMQQQQHDSSNDSSFRPTYHGEAVHEIRPIAIGNSLAMEEVSFNAFFDNQRDLDHDGALGMHQQNDHHSQGTPESEKMSLTFVPHVTDDDELSHFSQPGTFLSVIMIKKETLDDSAPKPPSKDSFQDSFLNYLQGHKQETLSSVSSSAVTKKPQLPKYIPEPRRPKPTPAPKENLNYSDTDDGMSGKMRDYSDNDSSHKSESDKEGYSVQRTSELAVKITLPKSKKRSRFGPFAESSLLKDSMRRNREGMLKRKRRKSKHREPEGADLWPGNGSEDDTSQRQPLEVREPTPPPVRTSIGRKAKEKCIEKTKKHIFDSIVAEQPPGTESSTEEEIVPFKSKGGFKSDDSDKNYDSDKDPIWMPFEVDLKQGHEFDEKRKKTRRPRMRMASTKSSKSSTHRASHSGLPPAYTSVAGTPMMVHPHKAGSPSAVTETAVVDSEFKVGMYVIEKKDLQNYESYPIWKLEQGNMIRKFEIKIQDGKIQHVAVGTFSTWMQSMESQFELIQVREVFAKSKSDPKTVEVLEECRPKLPSDGRLEMQYEDDPLVEPFNVYLQVFLSQALEPNFLSAILETSEKFYVDALNQIDHMIENKCEEITRQAHWKASFKECLHRCPLMKEIDRPNLKQPCQASENSSPPTIKSVLLSGQPYDRFLLVEQPTIGLDVAQEFMIGKVAAYYVRTYHSLYHFKYWLRQRCDAKVKMMKESNKNENLSDEVILEKCLENTSWVLQLFDNLKNLLKYGGEAPR
ncbi:unnamed protein product [Lymnaea stagnalis]|uniref:DUF4211 domain-containing protein n=1 Tax=Lymnaea stagnalis TaxID=6523 RepID=A0AAV2HM20_LYMST